MVLASLPACRMWTLRLEREPPFMATSLFRPGQNCAAVAAAERVAFIVDAEDYFLAFMKAAERAERSITILAWDFDSRTPLCNHGAEDCVELGDFLNGLADKNRHLRIRILDWDFPVVYGTDRETPPTRGSKWKPHRHVDFRFDDTHPVAGSHHQKIIVIDGRMAFAGGLDLTNKRWDTRRHKAAKELAKVAAARWKAATGETLSPVDVASDPWPPELEVDIDNVQVAISCTAPRTDESPGVRQVERLYLDMIAAARSSIYIENQYFTSDTIGAALKESLAKPEGPEIFVVTRLLSHGWLEEMTMTTLRTKLVRELRAADVHGRFHAVYPDVPGLCEGTCLDIHSKVMVVDDEWLRIGSSNLSNRSMGMDTECDVTLEAQGDPRVKKAITRFRDCLLAEHSDCQVEDVEQAIARTGTMAGAVAGLGTDVRRFRKLESPELPETKLALAKIGDPGEPIFEGMIAGAVPDAVARAFPVRKLLCGLGGLVVVALALALAWTHTPLAEWVTRENAAALADTFAGLWWAPFLIVLAYTPASFVMFPRWLITMTAVLAFGPWKGFVYGFAGILLAGVVTFLPGRFIGRDRVRRLAGGPRLKRVVKFMQQRGVLAVTCIRLVPIAPFPVVNLVMGAMRVKLSHFIAGTFLGMLPGMLAATVLSDQLAAAIEEPARVNAWLIAGPIVAIITLAFFGQRLMRRNSP
jgi:phospholipase D1/2